MDPDSGTSASDWLAAVDERELRHVIAKYGEEPMATRIARAIVSTRDSSPVRTTTALAGLVESVVPARRPGKGPRKHPATKTFQAIRIVINEELRQLETVLAQSLAVLKKGGRICVISFHSLEDRLVKRFMRDASRESEQYRGMPSIPDEFRPKLRRVGKVIVANAEEIESNRRSRSARLRIAERI
jgi:16S rRNA (cytosine1402-N4)-methyltransferase